MGFRVVAANQQPDFRTICRFRAEHEAALERLFVQVLRLCREAGLVQLGVVALDGTKVEATAALAANREYQAIEAEVQRMLAEARANVTDPASRIMKTRQGYVQGYNVQAVMSQEENDQHQLTPMLHTIKCTLEAAGIAERPQVVLADAGYWSEANLTTETRPEGPELLIATTKDWKQ
ncbi:MAG: transposase, partial [Dehalococcoidia bacterium]|nr:transposase [Dehalococcoidia bacterium]